MKFKVGDRVRCTVDMYNFKTKNKKAIIKYIIDRTCTIIFDEYIEGLAREHKAVVPETVLELIEENADTKQFTLDDLKVGYLVELRYGNLNMVMNSKTRKILIDEYGSYLTLDVYNNNFKINGTLNKYDIMKVYGFTEYENETLDFSIVNRELLWERKEILNGKEKEYLSSYIEPFRDRVKYITKYYYEKAKDYYISIEYENDLDTNFPYFAGKEMYKGMELYKKYTLEELGL